MSGKGQSLPDRTYVWPSFCCPNCCPLSMLDNPAATEQAAVCTLACRRHRRSEPYERVGDRRQDRLRGQCRETGVRRGTAGGRWMDTEKYQWLSGGEKRRSSGKRNIWIMGLNWVLWGPNKVKLVNYFSVLGTMRTAGSPWIWTQNKINCARPRMLGPKPISM